MATSAAAVLIMGLFELTCYYYAFVILLAPLVARSRPRAVLLLGMVAGTQFLYQSGGWFDELYTWESLLVIAGTLLLLLDLIGQGYGDEATPATVKEEEGQPTREATPTPAPARTA